MVVDARTSVFVDIEIDEAAMSEVGVMVEGFGRFPPIQVKLSPVAVPRLTMLPSTDASWTATVLEVCGHQHCLAFVTVLMPLFNSQPTHSFEVPLQYARPTQASSVSGQYEVNKCLWARA